MMDDPQSTEDAGTRRQAALGRFRGWKAYAAAAPLAVLMTPVVLLLAAVRIVAGSRASDRLIDAVDRRLGGSAAAAAGPDQRFASSDAPAAAPNRRNRRSRYERLYEGARIMVLVASAAALLQMWQGWPVFDYVAMAFLSAAVVAGGVVLGDWLFERRRTSRSAVS